MKAKSIAVAALSLLTTSLALAVDTAPQPLAVAVPLEDGGLFALAGVCLAIGIRIVQSKRKAR